MTTSLLDLPAVARPLPRHPTPHVPAISLIQRGRATGWDSAPNTDWQHLANCRFFCVSAPDASAGWQMSWFSRTMTTRSPRSTGNPPWKLETWWDHLRPITSLNHQTTPTWKGDFFLRPFGSSCQAEKPRSRIPHDTNSNKPGNSGNSNKPGVTRCNQVSNV